MLRMFPALVAVFVAAALATSASAQTVRERVHVREEEHVRIHQGGPAMRVGQRYGGISDGYRGLIAVNLNFGGGRRRFQSYEPVRRANPGDCVVHVDGRRPPRNRAAEIERMTDACLREASVRGHPRPRVVVELY